MTKNFKYKIFDIKSTVMYLIMSNYYVLIIFRDFFIDNIIYIQVL